MRSSAARRARAAGLSPVAIICLSLASLGADAPPALLFHASFDRGASADYARGNPEPFAGEQRDPRAGLARAVAVPGAFGKGITRVAGSFEALGNLLAERGTLAFFARLTGPDRSTDPLQVRTLDAYYWGTYLRAGRAPDHLAAWVPDEAFAMDLTARGPPGVLLTGERWRHIAIAWDQAYGVVFYLDGERVSSTWGQRSWLSRGVDPAELLLGWADGSIAYDELYVFDRVLGDAQIRALARSNRVPEERDLPEPDFDARRRANRVRELGWEAGSGITRLTLDSRGRGALVVRQVVPLDARAVLAEAGAVADGKLGQGWPPLYGYEFNGGNGLSVQLDEPFDSVLLEGRLRARVYAGRSLTEPSSPPLHSFQPEPYASRWRLPEVRSGWLTFFGSGRETERRIAELGFFRIGAPEPPDPGARRWFLSAGPPAEEGSLLDREIAARYAGGDRTRLGIAAAPEMPRGSRKLAGLRFHHIVVPARDDDWGLRGLRLVLDLRGPLDGTPLRLELRDPLHPGRRLAALDVELAAMGELRTGHAELLLDLGERVVATGQPLWIVLVAGSDLELETGGPLGSRVELLELPLEQAVPGFLTRELPVVRAQFRQLSEERPWIWYEHPERELVAFNLRAREFFPLLSLLHRIAPSEPRVQALWLWTHKRIELREPQAPSTVAGHAAAPAWALWQRELLLRCRAVLDWWIEHRQAPSGEFGDDWNDDTDLIQNIPALALLSDPGGKLHESARAVADGVYTYGRMRNGLNARLQDPLHAYEEGMNAQQVMALLAPGEPRYLERLMDSARAIEENLMQTYAPHRRAFRSERFSASEVQTGPATRDTVHNALLLGPALTVAYYNGNPRAVRMAREWLDGWLDDYPADLPGPNARVAFASGRRPDGSVTDWEALPRGLGYVSLFPALYALTREARYRDVTRYWTGAYSGGAFLEYVSTIHEALELLDGKSQKQALIRWSRSVELSRVSDDDLGDLARRRLLESELTGDAGPAVEALAAGVRNLRALSAAYTWGEPIADRINLPSAALAVMSQGGLSHERNQLWPQHYVSYSGFSDLAAWVREKSSTHLRISLYSFAPQTEAGSLRLWRAAPGRYSIRVGPDADGDGTPDDVRTEQRSLKRFSILPLELEPGHPIAFELERVDGPSDADAPVLPDLALSAEDTASNPLEITLHNLGSGGARDVRVVVSDSSGSPLAERYVPSLEAPLDLKPRRQRLQFAEVKIEGDLTVRADPDDRIEELNETNNVLVLKRSLPATQR